MIVTHLRQFCYSVVWTLSLTLSALAQGNTAQVSGMVTDPSGAAVADATVTARHSETSQTRTTQTSSTGQYVLNELRPGPYEISVEAPGLVVRAREGNHLGIELTVGQQATLNVALQLASIAQSITVTEGVSMLESARTEQSQVLEQMRIENLPINGRQFLDFALLTSNVFVGRGNIGNELRPGEPNQIDLSFLGLEETASLVTVDGADNTNRVFGRSRPTPSQEAVREFRVVTHNYAADQGPAASSVINIITRSGGNSVRGSAYYYGRSDALDARNMLAPPGFDELKQNQFGGTLGGPAVRDRLFYFGNYEGQRRDESPFYSTVLLNNLAAINTTKAILGLPPEVLTGKLRETDYDSLTLRTDYQAAARHTLGLTYRFRDDRNTNLGAATGQLSAPSNFRNSGIRDQALIANVTSSLSSNLVNQGLFQFSRHRLDSSSVGYEPHLQIPGTLNLGRHVNAVDGTLDTQFEFGDTLSMTRGNHSVKFGGNFYHVRQDFSLNVADPASALFPNLDAFLGRPPFPPFPFAVLFSFATGPDGSRPPAQGFDKPSNLPVFAPFVQTQSSVTHYALFVQDQWRATSKLALNFGLRWDVDQRPKAFYDSYYKAFQPRLGLAYNVLADRLVLRAGAGIYQGVKDTDFYQFSQIIGQPASLAVSDKYSIVNGGLQTKWISNPAIAAPALLQFTHTGIYPAPTPTEPFPTFFLATQRSQSRGPYTYQWSAQLDYRLLHDLSLSTSYAGARGLNTGGSIAANVAPAQFTLANGKSDYSIAPGIPVTRVFNPLVAPLSLFGDDTGQSTYHAGTLTITKRLSRRYSWVTNYTWSKTIGNSGGSALVDFPEDPYRRDLERSLSKQHVGHRFVSSFTAEGPERGWLRDFRFSAISSLASPQFYTVYAGFDVNNDGNPLTDRVGTTGRNTFKGDSYVNFDVRLARMIRLSERVRAQIVAEAFNLFNTLNVTEVDTVYGSPVFIGPEPKQFGKPAVAPLAGFGSIRAIAPSRQIQFALRFSF